MLLYTVLSVSDHQPTTDELSVMIHGFAAQKFGVAKLCPWQLNAIIATIKKKDSLIIQPTGAGKSMCYIIPPIYSGKTAIVISPTISLMLDQVKKLTSREVRATLLGSAQKEDVAKKIEDGNYQLVYTTPESFFDKVKKEPKEIFLKMYAQQKLCVIAIDEAHLIPNWKSFR